MAAVDCSKAERSLDTAEFEPRLRCRAPDDPMNPTPSQLTT